MNRLTLFFTFCLLPILSFGQGRISIQLKNVTDSLIFPKTRAITKIVKDSVQFQNIPDDIIEYKIKEYFFYEDMPALNILYGITNSGHRKIIFDTNFDGNLQEEYVYIFDKIIHNAKAIEDSVLRTIPSVEIIYPGMKTKPLIKPVIFNRVAKYQNAQDSKWHLFVESNYDRMGSFNLFGNSYIFYAKGLLSSVSDNRPSNYYILEPEKRASISLTNNPPFRLKDSININSIEFSIDSITPRLDQVWLEYRSAESLYGIRQGEFADNIIDKTIYGKEFNLNKLKGSYILIDFWGSWCGPCIDLIPKIKAIHEKFSHKGLIILSVGCDDPKNFGKMKGIIEKEKMDWNHIFTNFEISSAYNVSCFPTTIIIDPGGKIVYRSCGAEDFGNVQKKIEDCFNLIKENAKTTKQD